jgi:hypothetical protein
MIKVGKRVASPSTASQNTEEEDDEIENEADEISLGSTDTEEGSEKSSNTHDVSHERFFRVNKDILCATSMFFRKATNSAHASPDNRVIALPEENPEHFSLYLKWLKTQDVAVKKATFDDGGLVEMTCLITLAHCYILGSRMKDAKYQDATLTKLINCIVHKSSYPCNEAIRMVYAGTTSSPPARNLLVDVWLWRAGEKWDLEDTVGEAGAQFANDVIKNLVSHRELLDGQVP